MMAKISKKIFILAELLYCYSLSLELRPDLNEISQYNQTLIDGKYTLINQIELTKCAMHKVPIGSSNQE